jgi:hypothetical protein
MSDVKMASLDQAEIIRLCKSAKESFETEGRPVGMKMAQMVLDDLESNFTKSVDNAKSTLVF